MKTKRDVATHNRADIRKEFKRQKNSDDAGKSDHHYSAQIGVYECREEKLVMPTVDLSKGENRHWRGACPPKPRRRRGAAPLKTIKEPGEKHRLEPYFIEAEKKNFNHLIFET